MIDEKLVYSQVRDFQLTANEITIARMMLDKNFMWDLPL